jgi:hypothetical protein
VNGIRFARAWVAGRFEGDMRRLTYPSSRVSRFSFALNRRRWRRQEGVEPLPYDGVALAGCLFETAFELRGLSLRRYSQIVLSLHQLVPKLLWLFQIHHCLPSLRRAKGSQNELNSIRRCRDYSLERAAVFLLNGVAPKPDVARLAEIRNDLIQVNVGRSTKGNITKLVPTFIEA